jgi:hypothetical protein
MSLPVSETPTGLSQKWNKLRRRCASFKGMSTGPASLDAESETNYILPEPSTNYQIMPHKEFDKYTNMMHSSNHMSNKDYDVWNRNSLEKTPSQLGEHIRNLSTCNRLNIFPEECGTNHRVLSNRSLSPNKSQLHYNHLHPEDGLNDWDYEQICDQNKEFQRERLKYYDDKIDLSAGSTTSSVHKKHSIGSDGGFKIAKELKFPSFKGFKSASMRLPGQKTSIHEVSFDLFLSYFIEKEPKKSKSPEKGVKENWKS